MMIEDVELRNIYKTASEEHVQNLEDGLLHLEKHPNDKARLEEVLREAHTLKGDSRMLGVNDVETLTHHLEDILAAVKRGEKTLSPQICDRLYQGVDAIRKLVHEAATGASAGVNVFYVLAQLMGADSSVSPEQNSEFSPHTDSQPDSSLFPDMIAEKPELFNVDALFPDTIVEKLELFNVDALFPVTTAEKPELFNSDALFPDTIVEKPELFNVDALFPDTATEVPEVVSSNKPEHEPVSVPAPKAQAPSVIEKVPAKEQIPPSAEVGEPGINNNYHIDTIRVEPQKLDALMTQAGELTVTKLRFTQRMAEIEEIVTLWEEWSRDTFVNRLAIEDVGRGLHNGAIQQVQKFNYQAEKRLERLGTLVNRLKNTANEDTARLDIVANELESGIRTLRMLPLSTIFNLFPRMVRDLAKQQSKEVNLVIEGAETKADKRILEEMKDPLMHMIRNSIDHGIETPQERELVGKPRTATIRLRGYQTANSIGIEILDDGRGLDIESIKRTALRRGVCSEQELAAMTTDQIKSLIFAPGFSTRTTVSEISGRGVGMDVVRANVERLKGTIQVDSTPGKGCTFRIQLNTTLATSHVLIVEVNRVSYAIPVEFVQTSLLVAQSDIFAIEGCQTIVLDGQPVSVARLADLLQLQSRASSSPRAAEASKLLPCIILKVGTERMGILVDALLDEQDVVLKPQSKLLKRIRNVSGATILGTGEVCMILNPQDLLNSVRKRTVSVTSNTFKESVEKANTKQTILLVEDSITIRTQVKRILENAGYEVKAAVDGLDGFNKLRAHTFDAVVSDVQMPNMDGLSLAAKIRQYKEYSELPIVLCTTLASDEDKKRGAEAGANAYLTKGNFDQKVLLDTLRRLV
jgi:two-component system chemotaxis sensor kinase CheA